MANPIDYFGDITLHGGALKSVALEAVDALPATPVEKQIVVFNKTVQVYIDGKWSVLGSTDNIKTVQDALDALTDRVKAVEDGKVDKVSGKQLSTEDYTTAEQTKLAGIAEGAQVNKIESIYLDGVAQTLDVGAKKVTLDLSAYAKSADLVSVLDWKGTVATVSALPTASEANKGDIYHVTENGGEYVSDGSEWQELGSIVDLSKYYNKTEIDNKVSALNTAIDGKVTQLTTKPKAGTYTKVTINAEGQVTEGAQIAIADISDIGNANVATAKKLASKVGISITGGATASAVQFDGSEAIALNVTAIDGSVVSTIPVASVPEITTGKITDFTSKVQETVGAQFKSVPLNTASVSGNKYTITTAKKAFGVMVLNAGVQVFVSTTVTDTSIVLDFNSAITPAEFTVTYIEQF